MTPELRTLHQWRSFKRAFWIVAAVFAVYGGIALAG